jgi:hypothetical protein
MRGIPPFDPKGMKRYLERHGTRNSITPAYPLNAVCDRCGLLTTVRREQYIHVGYLGRERFFCPQCGRRVKRSRAAKRRS